MIFFDSHCHLDLLSKKCELSQVLNQCAKSHIKRILMPGTHRSGWAEIKDIRQRYSGESCKLDYALGLHPYFVNQHKLETDLSALENALKSDPDCIAVGETGLDFAMADEPPYDHQLQIELFYQQLKLAKQFNLPVIIHHRKSIDKICQLVRQAHFDCGGVIHAFSGSLQQANQLIKLGFKLGIGGTITYPRAQKTREVVRKLAAHHFLLETDAPDMPVCGRQGQPNSPEFLTDIFNVVVELQQLPAVHLSQILWQNTFDCFPRLAQSG